MSASLRPGACVLVICVYKSHTWLIQHITETGGWQIRNHEGNAEFVTAWETGYFPDDLDDEHWTRRGWTDVTVIECQ
jgi:hypothetical protein